MQFEEHEIEIKRFQKHLMFIVWPFFLFFFFCLLGVKYGRSIFLFTGHL